MALANVALTDTFDTWRIRTNQLIVASDLVNTKLANVVAGAPINITWTTTNGQTNATINIATSGVTSSRYGGTTQIPSFSVDSYGRITSASNISFTGGSTVANETASSSTYYPVFTSITTGTMTTANIHTTALTFVPSTGTLSSTAFNSLSDATLKDNVTPINNSLDILKSLNGVSFDWKNSGQKSFGVIAQDVEKVIPELVGKISIGKTVNYDGIIAFLIESIKELNKEIENLKKKQ